MKGKGKGDVTRVKKRKKRQCQMYEKTIQMETSLFQFLFSSFRLCSFFFLLIFFLLLCFLFLLFSPLFFLHLFLLSFLLLLLLSAQVTNFARKYDCSDLADLLF